MSQFLCTLLAGLALKHQVCVPNISIYICFYVYNPYIYIFIERLIYIYIKRAGGEGDVKVLILQGFEGFYMDSQSKGQFDMITTVYSKANHAKTSKINNKTADPIGALV